MRPRGMVDGAIRILLDHEDADCVRGVVPAKQNPFKMWRFNGEGRPLHPLLEVDGIREPYNAPRQVLPPVYWQTGHIDAIRVSTILEKHSLTGDTIYPLVIDPPYTADIDTLEDWAKYEDLVYSGGLQIVSPGKVRRPPPSEIKLIIFDFDGVVTDNFVLTDEDGKEIIAASRSDSMHIGTLRQKGVETMNSFHGAEPCCCSAREKDRCGRNSGHWHLGKRTRDARCPHKENYQARERDLCWQ